jgi:excisionase family DNA binding protein
VEKSKNKEEIKTMMLTVRQAAQNLGLQEVTIRKMIRARSISFMRIGRAVRISSQEVDRLITHGTVPAVNSTSAKQKQAQTRKAG